MTVVVKMDESGRVVIPRGIRRMAGIAPGEKLKARAMPGQIVLEVEPNSGKIVKRGKLKVWTGEVPRTSLEEAVDLARHYER